MALLAITAVATVLCLPMLLHGAPNGHSIEYNLVWLREFSQQLLQGEIYPRWLVDMNRGAGSPVFFYYGSLPFYISSIGAAVCSSCRLVVQLAIGEWLLIALSGAAFYVFARRRVDTVPAVLAAVLYMALPYHFEIDLWRRQAIGELATYIWMPLILHYTDKLAQGKDAGSRLALVYAMLLFSHLPTALLFSFCLGLYLLWLMWHSDWQRLLRGFAGGIGLGVLLAAIYLMPALLAEEYISASKLWTPYFDFHHWFYPGHNSPDPRFTERLFNVLNLTALMFALLCFDTWRTRRVGGMAVLVPPLGFAVAAWFLMTPLSLWLWELAPLLWKVQFPWRIAVVFDLAVAIIALYPLQRCFSQRDYRSLPILLAVAALLAYCLYSGRDVAGNLDSREPAGYLSGRDWAIARGVDAPEYATAWSKVFADDPHGEIASMDQLRFDASHGSVKVLEWEPRHIALAADLRAQTDIVVRQFYFPGWEARMVEVDAPLAVTPTTPAGLLQVAAPPGRYAIELKLAPLREEIAGVALSAIGLLVFAMWSYRTLRTGGRMETRN